MPQSGPCCAERNDVSGAENCLSTCQRGEDKPPAFTGLTLATSASTPSFAARWFPPQVTAAREHP